MTSFIYKLIPGWFKIGLYRVRGNRPWSKGYFTYKFNYIKEVINDPEMMKRFKNLEHLPKKYGYALDERVVEYPWLLSRFPQERNKRILDAGSALNFKEILESPSLKNKEITILNLNPEENCFWQDGLSYIFGDIRSLPFKDDCFDHISCISTLEHIGMDNILYTKDSNYREEKVFDFEKAVLELKRVLKREGKLFITLPFGKYQNLGRSQQFDSKMINRVLEIFTPKDYQINYYKYTKEGWDISNEMDCRNSEYFDIYKTKHFDKKSYLDFDSDFAAASRAVGCLELIKQ